MKMKKWDFIGLFLIMLLILGWKWFAIPLGLHGFTRQSLDTPSDSSPAPKHLAPRDTQYVAVKFDPSHQPLVAGEEGTFELEARINDPADGGPVPVWDPHSATPLLVWISSPADSGIAFIDEYSPDRPHQHSLVKFTRGPGNPAGVLTAKVNYVVNPRTKAGNHRFWMDILAELSFPDGRRSNDLGLESLPFTVDTHLHTKLLMLFIVGLVVFLFVVEWVRVDVVAILMMVLLPELNLLDAQYAFRGLSSNAVVAIIGVMIVSAGLNRTGLVDRVIEPLMGMVGNRSQRLVVVFSGVIAAISSVMQNTGAAVLFLPAIRLVTLYRLKIPMSRVLMPIGMAAILGGTLTMIGTSPLILLNDILPPGMKKFGFLELTPIGLALVIGGITYLSTLGLKILAGPQVAKEERGDDDDEDMERGILSSYDLINGPFEIKVPEDYRSHGGPQEIVQIRRRFLVNVVATARDEASCELAPLPHLKIEPGIILCAFGPEKSVQEFTADYGLEICEEPRCFKTTVFNPSMTGLVETVVSPRSNLIGQTIKKVRFRETFGVSPLALLRGGRTYYQDLADQPLQAGDIVLIHGTWEQIQVLREFHRNLIITPFLEEYQRPKKAKWALFAFLVALGMMLLSSFYFQNQPYNPIPLAVCLMVGAVLMILTRVMSVSEAYHAVDWRTVFLLGGLIPLGMAVDQTGTAQWLASGIIFALHSVMSPLMLLFLLAALSGAFSLVVSNVGACTLLVPLGVSLATQLGIDPRAAVIVIGLGVSNSFLLPTHQVNVLYMGPGGYSTKDYIKVGGILSLIYVVILVAMSYLFYLPH